MPHDALKHENDYLVRSTGTPEILRLVRSRLGKRVRPKVVQFSSKPNKAKHVRPKPYRSGTREKAECRKRKGISVKSPPALRPQRCRPAAAPICHARQCGVSEVDFALATMTPLPVNYRADTQSNEIQNVTLPVRFIDYCCQHTAQANMGTDGQIKMPDARQKDHVEETMPDRGNASINPAN